MSELEIQNPTKLSYNEYCAEQDIDPQSPSSVAFYTTALAANYRAVNPVTWGPASTIELPTQLQVETGA